MIVSFVSLSFSFRLSFPLLFAKSIGFRYLSGYDQNNPFLGSQSCPTILSSHRTHSVHLHWFSSLSSFFEQTPPEPYFCCQNSIFISLAKYPCFCIIQVHSTPRFLLTSLWVRMGDSRPFKGPGVQSSSAWQLQFLICHLYNLLLQFFVEHRNLKLSTCSTSSPSIIILQSCFLFVCVCFCFCFCFLFCFVFVFPATRTFVFFTLRGDNCMLLAHRP